MIDSDLPPMEPSRKAALRALALARAGLAHVPPSVAWGLVRDAGGSEGPECDTCGCPEDRHIMDDGSCVRPACDCRYFVPKSGGCPEGEEFEDRDPDGDYCGGGGR